MHRFFLDPQAINDEVVIFPPEVSRQILRVLRLRSGDDVVVLPGDGSELVVKLDRDDGKLVTGLVSDRKTGSAEPFTRLTLLIALTQREKFEFILQKCTEIGVAAFLPVITSRTLPQGSASTEKKQARWRLIIKEAAEQSGRTIQPVLLPVMSLADGLRYVRESTSVKLIAWEGAAGRRIRDEINKEKRVSSVDLLVGPEGGLSVEEITLAESFGCRPVTLGKRIMRMETAAIVAAALVFDALESS